MLPITKINAVSVAKESENVHCEMEIHKLFSLFQTIYSWN